MSSCESVFGSLVTRSRHVLLTIFLHIFLGVLILEWNVVRCINVYIFSFERRETNIVLVLGTLSLKFIYTQLTKTYIHIQPYDLCIALMHQTQ